MAGRQPNANRTSTAPAIYSRRTPASYGLGSLARRPPSWS